jgi:hypothetical protein
MTKIGTISNTIRSILMVTVLAPAPLLAEPAATARQMLILAQTQAQDHAVKSEIKKITERGPILTETAAVTPFSSKLEDPDAILLVNAVAAESKIEPSNGPTISSLRDNVISVLSTTPADPQFAFRVPAYQIASTAPLEIPNGQVDTASIARSPPLATVADTVQVAAPVAATIAAATTSPDTLALARAQETQLATVETTLAKADRSASDGNTVSATAATRNDTGHEVESKREVAVKPAVKRTSVSTKIANSSRETHQRHTRANSAVEFADSNIRPQLQLIINRPEVRSLMAQYGLN